MPTQVPFVPFVFTFLPRQAAEPPLSPGSLLYALNCFNMSDYMSDEHVLGTPGAPCRAKPLNLHSSRVPCYMCYMCYILHAKPPNLHSSRFLAICAICAISYTPSRRTSTLPSSLLYVLYVLYLTRQAAEPPLSPGSLPYVLYVLYILYARKFVVYVLYRAI